MQWLMVMIYATMVDLKLDFYPKLNFYTLTSVTLKSGQRICIVGAEVINCRRKYIF